MSAPDSASVLGRWTPAAFAVAAIMAVAGTYLIDPAMLDLGFALAAERTWIVGWFLLVSGAAMAFAMAPPKLSTGYALIDMTAYLILTFVIAYLTVVVLGIIQIALGIGALFGSPPNFWVAALLVPGALSIVLAFASIGENASDKTDAGDGGDAETEEAPDATTPDSGKLYGNATLRFSFIYALYYTVAMLTFMVWMWAGYWLYFRLDEAIFAGETLDGASAVASLSEAWRRLWPIAVALSGVIAVMMFLLTAGGPFLQWISQRGVPDANRDLSSAEAKFIDKSAERVRAYAQAQRYDRNVLAFQGFSLIAVFASSGAVIGLLVLIAGSLAPKTRASFPVVLDSNLSAILWVFVGIFLCPLLHSILTRASRSYSERSGWVAIGEKNDYFTLTGKLTSFVRQRRLSATNEINPGAFLHAANLSFERYFYVPAAVLAAVAAFFSHRDYASADTITAEHFEVVDYWTLEQRRYTYGDVKEVAIRCSFGDKEGTIEGYRLQFDDGSDLDIYDNTKVGDQLAAYTAVDEKLRALGVPFVPAARGGWGRDGEAGFDADCVTQIAKAFPAERADAVRRLFHVETLRAAGQIWPWDAELAAAWLAGDSYDVQTAVALYTKAIASGRLKGHMLAVAYTGRGDAREIYEIHHGVRDAEMLLALRDYQKASTLEPTTSRYRDEALAYAALGAYDEALSAYKKALELDRPKPYWSLIGLARIERARGRYDEALRHLDQVLRVWGEDDVSMALYYQRARVLYLKGDAAGVVEAITKGLAHDAEDASALRYRACAQARLGAFAKAKADIAQTIKLAHAPPTDPAWARTPQAAAYYAAFDADRALIDAMAAGTATGDAKAKLCAENWQYRDTPRARSPLLP